MGNTHTTTISVKCVFLCGLLASVSPIRLRIVTLIGSRNGCSASGSFVVKVEPTATVREFLDAVAAHPKNPHPGADLHPYDPQVVGTRNWERDESKHGPNCTFNASNPEATITDAGLRNGSVLCMNELMRAD